MRKQTISVYLFLLASFFFIQQFAIGASNYYSKAPVEKQHAKFVSHKAPSLSLFPGNPVLNGGFEANPSVLQDWNVVNQAGGSGSWFVQTGTTSPFGFAVPTPTEGLQAAMSDQTGPGSHILYQDFVVPIYGGTLSFDLFVRNNPGVWSLPSPETLDYTVFPNQHIRVDIMDPLAPVDDVGVGVLQNIFISTALDPPIFGYVAETANLNAFAGQTIRLRFAEVDNQGNMEMGIDNVVIPSVAIGMVADDTTNSVVVFNADTDSVIGVVGIPTNGGVIGDVAISNDATLGFVTNFANQVYVIDLSVTPPVLASGTNPIGISQAGEDISPSPDGKFLVVCDGGGTSPVSVIDIAGRTETSTFSASCNTVEVCSDNSVLIGNFGGSIQRLAIDGSGILTDTGDVANHGDTINVSCAPGALTGLDVSGSGSAITSSAIPGLASINSSPLSFQGQTVITNPVGDRVFVRTSTCNNPATVDVFSYDSTTGALGATPLISIPVSAPGPGGDCWFGIDQIAIHPNGNKLYVSEPGALNVYDPATGALITSITDPAISNPTGVVVRVGVALNNPPVANDDSATVAEDSGANTIDVLGNDTDSDFDTLSITAVSDPPNGSAVVNGSAVDYTPDPDYNGLDSFTYTISDGNGGTATATVNLTVTEVNDPPTANDDSITTPEDTAITFPETDLTANDSAGPANEIGQTLTVISVDATSAQGGTVTLVAGNITYTPAADFNGPDSFGYTVQDDGTTNSSPDPQTATATVNVTVTEVNDPPVAVTDLKMTAQNTPVSFPDTDLTANDSPGPANESGQSLTVISVAGTSALGGSVTLVAGVVTYTPPPNFHGADNFVYVIEDDGTTNGILDPLQANGVVSITVNCPITVSPSTLPNGSVGVAYSQTVAASGGIAPYTYAVTAGALPAGLSLDPTTGVISGTPTAPGISSAIVTATDASGCSAGQIYTVVIDCGTPNAITVTPATLPGGNTGVAYSQTVSASGGTGPYTFVVSTGALPSGLSLNFSTGEIFGTPTTAGPFVFVITAIDTTGCNGSQLYVVDINTAPCPPITLFPPALSGGTVNTPYFQPVLSFGGIGTITYSVSSGALPFGLSIDPTTGFISGTPITPGLSAFVITATDSNGCVGSQLYTINIADPPCPIVTFIPSTVVGATIGAFYFQPIFAFGGFGAPTYSISSGALPFGLSINPISGFISGTPLTLGTFVFEITATDSNGCTGEQLYVIDVNPAPCPTITLFPPTLSGGAVNVPYFQPVIAFGGIGPFTYSVSSGTLPIGLSIDPTTGFISGTPITPGVSAFVITAMDSNGCVGSQLYTINITLAPCPTITFIPSTVAGGTIGAPYFQPIFAFGGFGVPTYSITSGALPFGLSIDPISGFISGTPLALGTFVFEVTATDFNGCTGKQLYVIDINPAPCPTITLFPPTLAGGAVNVPYFQPVFAFGGFGPFAYSVSSGALPFGLSIDPLTGFISGTPTTPGASAFVITATDANGCTGSQLYTINITIAPCPTITVSPSTVPGGTVGTPYSQVVAASGGILPYTFSISSGALPNGLSIDSLTGLITGTPTTAGPFAFVVTATDINGCKGSQLYAVVINPAACPTITLAPSSLPGGALGSSYDQTVSAAGGSGPYTFAVTSGVLPAGLALNPATGQISGTLSVPGTTSFVISATDANGCVGSQLYTVTVACPEISIAPSTLPSGSVGAAYNQTLTASGGVPGYSYGISQGALPPGLSLSAAGVISGTPTTGGTFTFVVTAIDENGCTGTRLYTIRTDCPIITVSPSSLPNGTLGVAYDETVTASGGTEDYTFTFSGDLPSGLSLNSSTGEISGTPSVSGVHTFSITATDANGCTGTQTYTVTISCATITLSPTSLPNGTIGVAYSQTIAASGGAAPYSFSFTSGTLPTGLTLSAAGVLSGTPTASGVFAFQVTATDANGCIGTRNYTVTISCATITLSPTSLPNGTIGVAYSQTITASGGAAPYSFSLTSGTLPTGLTLSAAGVLSGTPTASGVFAFQVTATDANGCIGTRNYTVTISCATITLSPTSLPNGTIGVAYSQTITASGGAAPYSFTLTSGTLPAGLTLTSAGVLSGTPTVSGVFSFQVTATDANGCIGTRDYTVTISCATITISPATLADGAVGTAYTQTLTASGGTAPYAFTVTAGALPAGLTLNASTGEISGTPTTQGTASFVVTATDENGCSATRFYTIRIDCPVITVSPSSLPNGTTTVAYSQTITASGGTAPYTFAVSAGSLPPGLTLNSSTGVLSGTPTTTGVFVFEVTATDSNGCTGLELFAITVNLPACPTITLTPTSLPGGTISVAYSQTISASGSAALPYVFTVSSGTLPSGLTLDPSTGVLSGTPTTGGVFAFVITATDSNNCLGSQLYTIAIDCPVITITPTALPNGSNGTPYSQTITATGSATAITFSVSGGTLPAGLSLDATTGVLSGTPTTAGTFAFTITATDNNGCSASQSYTVSISCPAIDVSPAGLPNGVVGTAYAQTVTASGGTGPYTFAVSSGVLPPGITLAANGDLTGTPVTQGIFAFQITATDANGCAGTRLYLVAIGCATITLPPSLFPDATVGTAYSQTIAASGGTAPYTYAVFSGTLPAGLTLNAATGELSGIPSAAGTYSFTVTATDANGCSGSWSYTINEICPVITLASPLADGVIGTPYSNAATASGGTSPYTYAVTSGALPTGLTLDTATGVISGTPTVIGDFSFDITATDFYNCSGSQSYTVHISPSCLFCDDFENGVLDTSWTYTKTWTESGGELTTTATSKKSVAIANPVWAGCSLCSVETTMQTAGGGHNRVWFLGWFQDKKNDVELMMKEGKDSWVLRQRVNGAIVRKQKFSQPIAPNTLYKAKIVFDGATFKVFIDDTLIITLNAVGAPSGTVGFQVKKTTAKFEYITAN